MRSALRRSVARLSSWASSSPPPPRKQVPSLSWMTVGKYFIIKPFVYASIYSASTAAATLALLSAPQFAAAPAFAKLCVCLVNCSTSFGVGSAHGSFNGAHRLLIHDRLLVRALPLGKIFDFLKSKDPKPLDMEVSASAHTAALLTQPHAYTNP